MLKDGLQGLLTMAVFEDLDVDTFWKFLAQTGREFHFAVDGVVVPDEAAYKTDNDDGRMVGASWFQFTAPRIFKRAGHSLRRGEQSKESQNQDASHAHHT